MKSSKNGVREAIRYVSSLWSDRLRCELGTNVDRFGDLVQDLRDVT
jgi:hypothetical protein